MDLRLEISLIDSSKHQKLGRIREIVMPGSGKVPVDLRQELPTTSHWLARMRGASIGELIFSSALLIL